MQTIKRKRPCSSVFTECPSTKSAKKNTTFTVENAFVDKKYREDHFEEWKRYCMDLTTRRIPFPDTEVTLNGFLQQLDYSTCRRIFPLLYEEHHQTLFRVWIEEKKPKLLISEKVLNTNPRVIWKSVLNEFLEQEMLNFVVKVVSQQEKNIEEKYMEEKYIEDIEEGDAKKFVCWLYNLTQLDIQTPADFPKSIWDFALRKKLSLPVHFVLEEWRELLQLNKESFFQEIVRQNHVDADLVRTMILDKWQDEEKNPQTCKLLSLLFKDYTQRRKIHWASVEYMKRQSVRILASLALHNDCLLPTTPVPLQITYLENDRFCVGGRLYLLRKMFTREDDKNNDCFFKFSTDDKNHKIIIRSTLSCFLPFLFEGLPSSIVMYILTFFTPAFSINNQEIYLDREMSKKANEEKDNHFDSPDDSPDHLDLFAPWLSEPSSESESDR